MRTRSPALTLLISGMIGVLYGAAGAGVQFSLGAYGGAASTRDADVRLEVPGGTDLTYRNVS